MSPRTAAAAAKQAASLTVQREDDALGRFRVDELGHTLAARADDAFAELGFGVGPPPRRRAALLGEPGHGFHDGRRRFLCL